MCVRVCVCACVCVRVCVRVRVHAHAPVTACYVKRAEVEELRTST